MTDLRTLLHESAPTPARELDMAAVRARSRRLGLRRVVALIAGMGAVVGAVIPAGNLVLAPSGGEAAVNVGPGPATAAPGSTTTTAAPSSAVSGAAPRTVESDGSPGQSTGSDGAPGGTPHPSEPDAAGMVGSPSTGSPAESAYPQAASCFVDSVGLGSGEQRRCRFTALTKGGASMRTEGPVSPGFGLRGEVFIIRDGETYTYDVQPNRTRAGELAVSSCGSLIAPGDLVEVVLTNASVGEPQEKTTLGAGDGWYCWE